MIELRHYQASAIHQLYEWFRANPTGNPIVSACVGAGKSVMIAQICKDAAHGFDSPGRVLVVVPSKELAEQNLEKLVMLGTGLRIGVMSASMGRKDFVHDKDVVIGTVGTLAKRADRLGFFDLCLIDECFVAGTMISTPEGFIPIEKIKKGDRVFNANGIGEVLETSKIYRVQLVEVRFSNGNGFIVTENHPVFTDTGWKRAGELAGGESLFSIEDLRALRGTVHTMDNQDGGRYCKECNVRESLEQAKLLLSILREEAQEPDEQKSSAHKNEGDTEEDKAPADKERRKWSSFTNSAIGFVARSWRRLGIRSGRYYENAKRVRLSTLLQTGYCKQGTKDRNRSGWTNSLWGKGDDRFKEGTNFTKIRVESVSRIERDGAKPVFNLHVSGHPSYFANGALVHNCHLVRREDDGMYRELIRGLQRNNAAVRVIGWTGTPFRGNGVWLTEGETRLFTDIAVRITMRDLLKLGFLSPLVVSKPSTTITGDGVGMRNGDYIVSQLAQKLDRPELTRRIAGEICDMGKDRKKWLVFCCTVEHAEHMAAELAALGVATAVVSAETPKARREEVIAKFRSGRIRAICNVAVLTTGFDVPEIDLIALVRNTKSPVLFTQICGRGLRISPHKSDCRWLDFTDTTALLGPVDAIRGRAEPAKKEDSAAPFKICAECGANNPAGALACVQCGAAFPDPEPKINTFASQASILSSAPKLESVAVDRITFDPRVSKTTDMPYLRINFHSGFDTFHLNLMLEHDGFPRRKALQQLKELTGYPIQPVDVSTACKWLNDTGFQKIEQITVDMSTKWKNVVAWKIEKRTSV